MLHRNLEINPKYSLEGLMLKLQYFGQLMLRADSLEKTLMLGKVEGKKQRGQQGMKCLDSITDSMDISLSKLKLLLRTGEPGMLQSMGSQRVRYELVTQQQVNILRRMRKYYKYFPQNSTRRH